MDTHRETGQTSTSLLERLKGQDQEAWRRFAHLYGPLVYRWCRSAGLKEPDAADVCQEVFRSVARAIDSFQRPPDRTGAFRAWLRTVTRNSVHDHFRKQGEGPAAAGGSEAYRLLQEVPALDGEEDEAEAERVGLVRRAWS